MRIEVAVEDRIADGLVAVARAVEGDFIGVMAARTDRLTVEIGRSVGIRREQPLVGVKVEDVMFLRPDMDVYGT
jgi:hypothetical protein